MNDKHFFEEDAGMLAPKSGRTPEEILNELKEENLGEKRVRVCLTEACSISVPQPLKKQLREAILEAVTKHGMELSFSEQNRLDRNFSLLECT